uniref:Uncharacterized protein n=1 Tax=Mustela putorius furo TaxID=9669 RepID=M3YB14_MUSPF
MDRPRDGTGRIPFWLPPRTSVPQGRVGAVDGRKPVDLTRGLSPPAVPRPLGRVRARLRGRRRLGPRPAQVTAHAGRRGGSVPPVSDGLSRSRSAPCSADGWDPGARKVRGSRGTRQPPGPAPTGRRPVGTEERGPGSPRSLRRGVWKAVCGSSGHIRANPLRRDMFPKDDKSEPGPALSVSALSCLGCPAQLEEASVYLQRGQRPPLLSGAALCSESRG